MALCNCPTTVSWLTGMESNMTRLFSGAREILSRSILVFSTLPTNGGPIGDKQNIRRALEVGLGSHFFTIWQGMVNVVFWPKPAAQPALSIDRKRSSVDILTEISIPHAGRKIANRPARTIRQCQDPSSKVTASSSSMTRNREAAHLPPQ
jgi:hypothetical protein